MYKITLLYQTGVNGEYVNEVEIAEDLEQAKYKRGGMINRWFEKLCDYIDFERYVEKILRIKNNSQSFTYDEITEMRLSMICKHTNDLGRYAPVRGTSRFFMIEIDKVREKEDIDKACETNL